MSGGVDDISAENILALLEQADGMSHGAAQVTVAEEAVRLADLKNDASLGFRARRRLIEATIFSGFPEKTLVAFAWCISRCDAEPERFKERESLLFGADLLWSYKWVIENAPYFPQITRAQLDETVTDMKTRYRKYGLSLRPVHLQRTRLAMHVEDSPTAAQRCFAAFMGAPRDEYADCEACERNFEVEYMLYAGASEDAIARARPLIQNELTCGEVPHVTLALLLRPLVELGRMEEAQQCRRIGYRLCSGQQNFLREIALLMDFESAMNGRQSAPMFERHLPIALATLDPMRRFWFLWASRNMLGRLAARGREAIAVKLPASVDVPADAAGRPLVRPLRAWCDEQVRELARAFDRRNSNARVSRIADDLGIKRA